MIKPLEIIVSSQDGCQIVDVAGEIDIVGAQQLHAALNDGRLPRRPLVADLVDVDFCDAAGLRCLLAAHAQSHRWNAPLRIVPSWAVRRVIDMARLQQTLAVYPNRSQALLGRAAPSERGQAAMYERTSR